MTEADDHVREALPNWTRPLDANARRMLGEIHEDDAPIVSETAAGWLIIARDPRGSDHAVVRPTYQECAAFLAALEAEIANANPEMVEPEQPAESDGGGTGTGDNGAGDDGVAAWIDEDASGDGNLAGDSIRTVDSSGPGEDAVSEEAPETVAVEESISAGEDFDVSIERAAAFEDITPADPATAIHGGMFVQQDDIARLIKKLAVDIAYRREDLFASIREKTDAAYSEQVRLQNVLAVTGESIADRFNEQQAIIADLIERKSRIDRFADDARRGLEGKTLDYLQTVDVGALPWPL